ncbi:MAG TPA: suppressor of fused domain protein [Gemmatimonadaceae bacterium]|nr:suppressor of fused domain protein [Gemmatimonadaceae bacterium]
MSGPEQSRERPTLLERAWEEREEVVYLRLFGPLERSIFLLDTHLFQEAFNQTEIDPRWLHIGVMIAAPTAVRSSWLYVSSGLSNPWESEVPTKYSGFGCELLLEAPSRADWAIRRLRQMVAYELLLAAGRYPERERLGYYDRVPLQSPITFSGESQLRNLMATPTSEPAGYFDLESGRAELLTLVGITDDEVEHARAHGGEALVRQLRERGAFPVTDPERRSVLAH